MGLCYGIDVYTPTTQRNDDPWKPVMKNAMVRQTFSDPESLVRYIDRLQAGNVNLRTRVVEVPDEQASYQL